MWYSFAYPVLPESEMPAELAGLHTGAHRHIYGCTCAHTAPPETLLGHPALAPIQFLPGIALCRGILSSSGELS